jgi:hypothetical protein
LGTWAYADQRFSSISVTFYVTIGLVCFSHDYIIYLMIQGQ